MEAYKNISCHPDISATINVAYGDEVILWARIKLEIFGTQSKLFIIFLSITMSYLSGIQSF
jgi:hypothetical protein